VKIIVVTLLLAAQTMIADQRPDRADILAQIIDAAQRYGDPIASSDSAMSYYLRSADYIGRCEVPFGPVHIARLFFVRSAPVGGTQPERGHAFIVFLDRALRVRTIWSVDNPHMDLSVAGSRLLLAHDTLIDFSQLPANDTVSVDGSPQKIPRWK